MHPVMLVWGLARKGFPVTEKLEKVAPNTPNLLRRPAANTVQCTFVDPVVRVYRLGPKWAGPNELPSF